MKHKKKIQWMTNWATKNDLRLDLKGSCGFGRKCVGVTSEGTFPDYVWFNTEMERIDNNGEVWSPSNAYHKHPCVAVLGRGKAAEVQLYDWLRWFDNNKFQVEKGSLQIGYAPTIMSALFNQHHFIRMVRPAGVG